MQFLTPLAFALASLAIPILLLYMLRLRRKQIQVSSTLLWTQLLRDQQANAPWQKLRRHLLLILQLLILAALVLSLARPALQVPVVASGSVIVLIDASASMNATDVAPSRFEAARTAIQELIDSLSGTSAVTLIQVSATPYALISSETDKSLLRRALDQASVTQGSANWQAAFTLAAGMARQTQEDATIVIFSDGGLPQGGLPALPANVRYVPVGESQHNLAISALALRAGPQGPQLFVEVTNYDSSPHSVLLSIYRGEELIDARQLSLPAASGKHLTLDGLPQANSIYKAQLSSLEQANQPLDSLKLDDTAFAVFRSSSARRVLLVSPGNLYLEQLLASLPGIQPFRALPAEDGTLTLPNDPFDLYIFDSVVPPQLPPANLLFVNAVSNPLFAVGQTYSEIETVQVHEHPLTRLVDWSNVHILQAQAMEAPVWAETLIESNARPLLFAGETQGQRVAALAFDLRQSDLPLQIAYPILFSHLIDYLAPPSAIDSIQALKPGEPLTLLPQADRTQVAISSPSGQVFTLASNENLFTQTHELGYYAVNLIFSDSTEVEYFAVNLFDEQESNIGPRPSIQVGRDEIAPVAAGQMGRRELWSWFAGLALVFLLIEWQAYHRRPLPSLRRSGVPSR